MHGVTRKGRVRVSIDSGLQDSSGTVVLTTSHTLCLIFSLLFTVTFVYVLAMPSICNRSEINVCF